MGGFQLSSQIVTLNFSSRSSDFNLGAAHSKAHVFKLVLLCASITSTPRSLQVADGVTEEDVVREPGCDNQEIKNKNQKNLKTQEQGKKKIR